MKTTMDRPTNFLRNTIAAALCALALGAAPSTTVSGTTNADVIWIDVPNFTADAKDVEIRNRDREFLPDVMVVTVGSQVRFPNDDSFYHSIYSDSKPDAFDIGYYGPGPGKAVMMAKPGIINVRCHIHARMHATIAVVDGPYALPASGHYALTGVVPGSYTLHAWSARAGERTMTINVPSDGLSAENVTL